jgi:hypothetical protein
MLMTGSGKAARVHYLPGTFRLLSDGDHVVCAVILSASGSCRYFCTARFSGRAP